MSGKERQRSDRKSQDASSSCQRAFEVFVGMAPMFNSQAETDIHQRGQVFLRSSRTSRLYHH